MAIQKVEREEEVWKAIDGFSNYEVSNSGKVRSKDRKTWHKGSKTYMKIKGKVMKQRWNKTCKCYFLDLIDDDGKRKTVYPHKEVAKAFASMCFHQNTQWSFTLTTTQKIMTAQTWTG